MLNLLKEIAVTGTVSPTHARLSVQFTFHNPTAHPLSPTYFFPVPKGASITGMQILTKEKTLLRAEIVPLTEPDTERDGFRLIQLEPQLYSLTWECLPAGDSCVVILECLLHLLPKKNLCRFILPLGLSTEPQGNPSPCPANLDLVLENLEPFQLSPQDSFDSTTGTFSTTAQTNGDFVLDLTIRHQESLGLLQEDLGKGYGFARLFFSPDFLAKQPSKTSVLLLLDLSHATTLPTGNAIKELFFRIYSAIPNGISVKCLSTDGLLPDNFSADELYSCLQTLPVGTGTFEDLLLSATTHQAEDTLTILVSTGSYRPSTMPDFPFVLATVGAVQQTALSHGAQGDHLHFYPADNQERFLTYLLPHLLSPAFPIEVIPAGGNVHEFFLMSESTATDGYLDLGFSFSGQPPQGFALWQNGQKKVTVPLLQTKSMPRFPDAEQLFAIAKIQRLTELLEKATPVSGRSIKRELAQLQTDARILGSETVLILPTEGDTKTTIPVKFFSTTDGLSPLSNRPTIFGDGVRKLPPAEQKQLAKRCRQVIYNSIRSDGSIHSPLGITPRVSAEETALSYLALLADGKTSPSILQDALTYLSSAPETPWSFLIQTETAPVSLQRLLSSLPSFETLVDSVGDSIPLMTACYLLLWISLT